MVKKNRSRFVRDYPHLAPLVVLAKAFVAIRIVIAFGTVGYRVIEGWPTLDCFYMTMITLTTIGFGEINPLSAEGRIFTVVIIFLGFGIVGYSALTGVRFFIEGEFTRILKRRQGTRRYQDLTKPQVHRAVDQEDRRSDLQPATGDHPRAGRYPDRHWRNRGPRPARLRLRVGSSRLSGITVNS